MFTGIINYTGTIADIQKNARGIRLTVQAPKALGRLIKIGSSLSHNGVCLTVIQKRVTARYALVTTFLMNETLRRTSFKEAQKGDIINIEPSLRMGDEVGGHFVFGHVDGVGSITSLKKDGDAVIMRVRIHKKLMRAMAVKGSVSIEGISLTLVYARGTTIAVSLIPHTMRVTNLKIKKVGDPVNIEMDMLARYALR